MGEKEKQQSSGHIAEEIEEALETLPKMELSNITFLLTHEPNEIESNKQKVMEYIKKDNMAPYYQLLCNEYQWKVDENLIKTMKEQNEKDLQVLEEKLKDAKENLGDVEVLEILYSKAVLFSRIGDKKAALEAFALAGEKPQSINQKILVALHEIRLGLFFSDLELVKEKIALAKKLVDEGGDWDRRNRLKVYEGCYLMMSRDFKRAATLFQESIATFTSVELMTYKQMIYYCVLVNVLNLPRVELKKKIVDSPEILTVINELPHLTEFLEGLYNCQYKKFFTAMVGLHDSMYRDKYLSIHLKYIYRELRVLGYSQFLEAYRSVKIDSMARAFGVSIAFLDSELSRFISHGRLNAKIDKVAGVIETNRPDTKNSQYQETIKKGDALLNRVQKLARVINV